MQDLHLLPIGSLNCWVACVMIERRSFLALWGTWIPEGGPCPSRGYCNTVAVDFFKIVKSIFPFRNLCQESSKGDRRSSNFKVQMDALSAVAVNGLKQSHANRNSRQLYCPVFIRSMA